MAASKRVVQRFVIDNFLLSKFSDSCSRTGKSDFREISQLAESNGSRAYLVDTLALVRRLEGQGLPSKQAEAITGVITEVLNDSLENVAQSFVSKGESQKVRRLEGQGLPSKQAEAITGVITEVLNDSLENVAQSFVSKGESQKVRRLEGQGLPSKQAEAITGVITEVLNDSLENVAQSFVSKGESQKVRRLEGQGLPSKQAEAITGVITEVLNDSLENVAQSFVSKGESQKMEKQSERFEIPIVVVNGRLKRVVQRFVIDNFLLSKFSRFLFKNWQISILERYLTFPKSNGSRAYLVDTLALVRRLEGQGLPSKQAEAITV
ncbi:hypothetical protein Syun_022472 [Stephania yunnanensis]|uniref:Uncharacterized protein n=1 Tax=Stephania yunnanensis TaxID=152371 RepID=A0AAP0F727_9MAGN